MMNDDIIKIRCTISDGNASRRDDKNVGRVMGGGGGGNALKLKIPVASLFPI